MNTPPAVLTREELDYARPQPRDATYHNDRWLATIDDRDRQLAELKAELGKCQISRDAWRDSARMGVERAEQAEAALAVATAALRNLGCQPECPRNGWESHDGTCINLVDGTCTAWARDLVANLPTAATALMERMRKMEDALEFYGAVCMDNGERARAALNGGA